MDASSEGAMPAHLSKRQMIGVKPGVKNDLG